MIHNHEVRSSILRPATLKTHGESSTCREIAGAFLYMEVAVGIIKRRMTIKAILQ